MTSKHPKPLRSRIVADQAGTVWQLDPLAGFNPPPIHQAGLFDALDFADFELPDELPEAPTTPTEAHDFND